MRCPTSTPGRQARQAGLLLLAGLLLVALPASAQVIKVTSAVPGSADQGTVGLVVTIGGENFASGAKVAFYVTGTTNPGGIAVKSVKFKDSKTLEATIDVAADAVVAPFDVQVKCSGRTGKGTELFKVLVKTAGGNTIPPGTVTDLRPIELGPTWAVLAYTVPADDGWLAASGPAAGYSLRVRKGSTDDSPDCGPFTVATWTEHDDDDPCLAYCNAGGISGSQGATGSTSVCLAPNTLYWAILRTKDHATPDPLWSVLADDVAAQISFVTPPAPPTRWTASAVATCESLGINACSFDNLAPFDFDGTGNPAVLYSNELGSMLATWTPDGWSIEPLPAEASGGSADFACDPSGAATIARTGVSGSRYDLRFFRRSNAGWSVETVADTGGGGLNALAFNPLDGTPTIAYGVKKGGGRTNITLRLAERRGSSWTSQDAVPNAGYSNPQLAFDADGNPAFVNIFGPLGGPYTMGFALRKNGTWTSEVVEDPASIPGSWLLLGPQIAVAFDAGRGDFSAMYGLMMPGSQDGIGMIRYCERSAGTWRCREFEEGPDASPGSLAVDASGNLHCSYRFLGATYAATRGPDGTWAREYADWNGFSISASRFRIGPQGQVGITHRTRIDPSGAGFRESVRFALRPAP